MVEAGFQLFDFDPRVKRWADAAWGAAQRIDLTPDRCGQTWFVGVDALPNTPDGAIDGVPLEGPWDVAATDWHPAQVSGIYSGYPRQDAGETDAAHRFRINRCAAHMDGLLPEGPQKRRHLREPHMFILGLPLVDVRESPLVVWPGSHQIMGQAFREVFSDVPPAQWGDTDVTDVYQAARRTVFDVCRPQAVQLGPGQSVLLHRHLIHGVEPWDGDAVTPRFVAYFRPQFSDVRDWL